MNEMMDKIIHRMKKWAENILKHGIVFQYTIDKAQLKNLDIDACGIILLILSKAAG